MRINDPVSIMTVCKVVSVYITAASPPEIKKFKEFLLEFKGRYISNNDKTLFSYVTALLSPVLPKLHSCV